MPRRTCFAPDCNNLLVGQQRKWCSTTCTMRIYQRQVRDERIAAQGRKNKPRIDRKSRELHSDEFVTAAESKDGRGTARRGAEYDKFVRSGIAERMFDGEFGPVKAAELYSDYTGQTFTSTTVSRWKIAYIEDRSVQSLNENWSQAQDVTDAIEGGYKQFAERFHPHILVPDTHLEWERHIDETVAKGGRLLLLAPQRHGKTEMLTRYCQRRIAADPNICILWVSRTKELAEESVGFVKEMLEDTAFAESVLGPGKEFRTPSRSGKSWTNEKFTVAQRTRVRKSPTMRAMGIGGTTSGRDADLIIIDDPQEVEDCDSPTTAKKQSKWFWTTFLARKMEHTGIAFITSRKAANDIPGEIIAQNAPPGDPEHWRFVRYQAHDEGCTVPETDWAAHDDCVLIPELRGFRFLMGQKGKTPITERFFETNYQNNPSTDKLTLLNKDDVEAARTHIAPGMHGSGVMLIVGADPAPSKPCASVLWAVSNDHAQIVDAAYWSAGPEGFNECLNNWHNEYGVRSFVLETNIAKGYLDHPTVKATIQNLVLDVRTHHTDHVNKNVGEASVVSMIQTIRGMEQLIRFPARGNELVEDLISQLLNYDPISGSKHKADDLVMAMWVAWFKRVHDRVVRHPEQRVEVDYASTAYSNSNYMVGI